MRKDSKETMKPFLKEILQAQEKGKFTINLPFDKDANISAVFGEKVIFERQLSPSLQEALLGLLLIQLEHKTIKDIKREMKKGKNYKREIEKYMLAIMDVQEKGGYVFSLVFDENADFCMKLFSRDDKFPPFPNNEVWDDFRYEILVAFLLNKQENLIPFSDKFDCKSL